ncbi:hypothetical protein pb186bvf_002869 [Paramecium bursaria]
MFHKTKRVWNFSIIYNSKAQNQEVRLQRKEILLSMNQLKYDLRQNKKEFNDNQKFNIMMALCYKYNELFNQKWPNWDLKNQKSILLIKLEQSQSMMEAIENNQFTIIFISSNFLKQVHFDLKEEILVLYKLLCEFASQEIRKILEEALLFSKDPISQLEQSINNLGKQQKDIKRNWFHKQERDNNQQIDTQEAKHILYQLIEQSVDSKTEHTQDQIKSLNQNLENIRQLSVQIRINLLKQYQLDKNGNFEQDIVSEQAQDTDTCNDDVLLEKANQIFGQPEQYQLQDLFLEYAVRYQYQDYLEFLEEDKMMHLIKEIKAIFLKDQCALYSTNYAKYLSNQLQINS